MLRVVEQGLDVCVLDHAPGVHDHHPVGHRRYHAEIVGDQDHGTVQALLKIGQQAQDLGLNCHVEGGRGLIGDQHVRLGADRRGDHDALAHPSAEVMRIVVIAFFGMRYSDQAQELDRLGAGFVSAHLLVRDDSFRDLVADREGGIQ